VTKRSHVKPRKNAGRASSPAGARAIGYGVTVTVLAMNG
jgi:hypothetical protein